MQTSTCLWEFEILGNRQTYSCYFDLSGSSIKSRCTCKAGNGNTLCWHRQYILSGKSEKIINRNEEAHNEFIDETLKLPGGVKLIRSARNRFPSDHRLFNAYPIRIGSKDIQVPIISVSRLTPARMGLLALTIISAGFCLITIGVVIIMMIKHEAQFFDLFVNLSICSLVYFVTGLISPKASLFYFKKHRTRIVSMIIYGGCFVLLSLLAALTY